MNGERAADVRSRAQAVGAVLRRAEELAPPGIEGVDATRAIRMTLGADGLPVAVAVEADWARALGPHRVGVAVGQAFADASTRRMTAWAEAMETAGVRPGNVVDAAPPAAEEQTHPRVSPSGRTIDDVAEAMIAAVHRPAPDPVAAVGVGSVADGRLVLTVSPSIGVRCEVDPHWAGMQSARSLTEALGAVLAAARADLAASVQRARSAQNDLDVLLADAFALLQAAADNPGSP